MLVFHVSKQPLFLVRILVNIGFIFSYCIISNLRLLSFNKIFSLTTEMKAFWLISFWVFTCSHYQTVGCISACQLYRYNVQCIQSSLWFYQGFWMWQLIEIFKLFFIKYLHDFLKYHGNRDQIGNWEGITPPTHSIVHENTWLLACFRFQTIDMAYKHTNLPPFIWVMSPTENWL